METEGDRWASHQKKGFRDGESNEVVTCPPPSFVLDRENSLSQCAELLFFFPSSYWDKKKFALSRCSHYLLLGLKRNEMRSST
jgi:hypothetical protein